MKKKIVLLLLVLSLALLLGGCSQYNELVSGAVESLMESETEEEPEATPIPALTAAKYTDAEAFSATYNQVKFSDTLDSLKERYGEPTEETTSNGEYYTWIMEDGTGFAAVFFENGKLRAKAAYYEDIRQMTEIAHGDNLSLALNLSDDVTYRTVCGIFGSKGVEILRSASNSSAAPEYTRVVLWLDGNGTAVQVLFDADDKLSEINTGEIGTDEGTAAEE